MRTYLLCCGLGAAVVCGVLFAFSSFVMAGLGRIAPPSAIAAMQSINITVINLLFMGLYLGMGLFSIVAVVLAWRAVGDVATVQVYAGALVYLAGVLGVTFAVNVPMNDVLAGLDPASADAARYWQSYLERWTLANHVRCLAALVSAALFLLARG